MKAARFRIVFFLLLIPVIGLYAQHDMQSVTLINLDSAWKMMEEHNIELQRLLIDQLILRREADNKKYWIPGISAGASLSRNSPFISWITNPDNAVLTEADAWSMRGSVDIRLNIDFNISLEDQAEAIELSILLLQRQARLRDLRVSLEKLYYQVIAGFNTIKLHEQSMELAKNRLEQIEIQYKQGLRSDLELLTAKIAAAKDQPALEKARVDQMKRLISFREYTGLEPGTTFELSPEQQTSPNLSADEISSIDSLALQTLNHDSLLIAGLQIKLAEINRELAANNLYAPSLNINLGWSTRIDPIFDSLSWTAGDWNDGLGLGLSFSVPLDPQIEGSGGRLGLQKLDDNIVKMKLLLEENRGNIKKQLQFLLLDLELSRSNIEVSGLNLTLQEQNFRKVQDNFDSGRSSLLALNDSRQDLRSAKLSLENEKLNQRLLLIDLERLIR